MLKMNVKKIVMHSSVLLFSAGLFLGIIGVCLGYSGLDIPILVCFMISYGIMSLDE